MRPIEFVLTLAILFVNVFGGQVYETLKGNRYYIEIVPQFSWFEAFFECSYRNMTLYTFESQAQFDDLYQLLTSDKFADKPPDLWLGAVGIKGKFFWIKNRKPMMADHLWSSGNPDNSGGNENCLHIWKHRQVFNDWPCLGKIGFVCEMDEVAEVACKNKDTSRATGSEDGGGVATEGKYKGLTINFLYQNN